MNVRMPATRWIAIIAVIVVVVVGGFVVVQSSTTDQQAACDRAVAEAMAIDPRSDTVASVDGAIARCGSLEVWDRAAKRYPDAFSGQDPTTLARDRCGASSDLEAVPVCTDIRGN